MYKDYFFENIPIKIFENYSVQKLDTSCIKGIFTFRMGINAFAIWNLL
jgi:hypothetical protein